MVEEVPGAFAGGALAEVGGEDAYWSEGVIAIAFGDGAGFIDDGYGVEIVAQDVAGFIEQAGHGAFAAEEISAVGRVPDVLCFDGIGHSFFDGAPLAVEVNVARFAQGTRLDPPREGIILIDAFLVAIA